MTRKYQNNYSTTITTATVLDTDLTFDVAVAPSALAAGEYYLLTLTDDLTTPTKTEIVKVTGIATNTLTVVRAQEGTTAQGWVSGDNIELRLTADTLTNTAKSDESQIYTAPQKSDVTVDNDLSFDLAVGGGDYKATTSGAALTLTFTNISVGVGGSITVDNALGSAISAAATTDISDAGLALLNGTGKYVIGFGSDDGVNVWCLVGSV